MTAAEQNSDFGLKLIDFGLARSLEGETEVKITKLQGTIGRPQCRVHGAGGDELPGGEPGLGHVERGGGGLPAAVGGEVTLLLRLQVGSLCIFVLYS